MTQCKDVYAAYSQAGGKRTSFQLENAETREMSGITFCSLIRSFCAKYSAKVSASSSNHSLVLAGSHSIGINGYQLTAHGPSQWVTVVAVAAVCKGCVRLRLRDFVGASWVIVMRLDV